MHFHLPQLRLLHATDPWPVDNRWPSAFLYDHCLVPLLTMHRSTSYNFWQQDSELYLHVKASSAEHLKTTTSHGQSTSQPHQHLLHFVPENTAYDPTPVVSQHHVTCDGHSTTEDQTVVPCDNVPDAGISPIPIAKGDNHSDAAGWHPRCVPSSYSPYALSDYPPAHTTGFSDVNPANPWSPTQGFQHDPPHQFQEEVYPHPQYVVNDDESKSHVDRASVCQWNDGHGACGKTINAAKTKTHMSSYHFQSPLPPAKRLKCLWKDCELHQPVRRDTIIRHIVEKHLGHKYRSKLWVASHAGAGSRGSRKNTHLH
ncbi:uncharacterized protein F5147DRAFT_836799 [Suillus discolor]|uniref:Uncharacterized protein n=1 Tax=Suillus discolor TaxID=1912936 RepID=A0A9P7F6P8_9AGAM|nr:uncharacterized protein F5147DRAFT_836799 [Suillus discolor]KAG2108931.1 hypothetical protein F5147DRAFT_836799 [Suillus discolor]